MRVALRYLLLLPPILLLIQLCGLVYLPWLGGLEHALLERVLVVGWTIDEARGATPAWLLAAGLTGGGALAVLLLGVAGPLEPAAGEAEATWPVLLLRAPLGIGLAAALGALVLFGVAVAPLVFVAVLAASAIERPEVEPTRRRVRATLGTALIGSTAALVFAASMLATSREGTIYDRLAELLLGAGPPLVALLSIVPVGLALRCRSRRSSRATVMVAVAALTGVAAGPAWGILAAGTTALALLAGRSGLPVVPDLTRAPGRWPWELARVALIAAATTLGSVAVEVPSCPAADDPAIRLVAPVRAPFDLDVDDRGHLAVVHREEGLLRLYALGDGAEAELLHELPAREGDLEEVFAIPGGRGFLVSEILDEEPKTLLLRVDPRTGEVREGRFAGMCWVSSVAWDEQRERILLGCETSPDLLALHPDSMELSHVGQLDTWDDSEDIALRADRREMYLVSLAEGDRLRAVDPDTGEVRRQALIGGFNYQVLHDPETDRVFVSRFCDSQVVAFDAETLEVEGRIRTGFSVRPLVAAEGRRLLLAGSMFRGTLDLLDPDSLRVLSRERVGGRVKALATRGDRAWIGTACGVYELDLEELERRGR